MRFSLDEHSSNHPVILEQLWRPICLMIVSQPLELGATMIIVQQVEDMKQSVEKMVRIKQTLIESTQTEGELWSTKVTDKEFAHIQK
eukprot:Em0011g1000a